MYNLEVVLHLKGKLTDSIKGENKEGSIIEFREFIDEGAELVWALLCEPHAELSDKIVVDEYSGKKVLFAKMGEFLKETGVGHFGISWDECAIEYSPNPSMAFARLDIKGIARGIKDAERWIKPLIDSNMLIQARAYDKEYDYWQNAQDLLQYQTAGRSIEGKTLISNGLPFPLEQEVIDISSNPGRWFLKQGYIESVGSVMWLGEQFWVNSRANKETVLVADWLKLQTVGNVLKIQTFDKPFTSEHGEEGRLQNKLRALLYPVG